MKAQSGELSFGPSKMYISDIKVEMCMSRALGIQVQSSEGRSEQEVVI